MGAGFSAFGARSVLHHVIIRLDETGELASGRRARRRVQRHARCWRRARKSRDVFQAASAVWGAGQSGGRHGFAAWLAAISGRG